MMITFFATHTIKVRTGCPKSGGEGGQHALSSQRELEHMFFISDHSLAQGYSG